MPLPSPSTQAPTATRGPLEPPVSSGTRADALAATALAAISALYLWPFRDVCLVGIDEGIPLQGAARILQGQLPYRDFFSFYTPGSYYWNALWMKLFGDSVLVPRTVVLGYGVLFSVLTFVLARRMASRTGAVIASLATLVCCLPTRFLVMHNWDSTAAALLALACALGFLHRPGWGWAAGVGFFSSLAALFNQARGAGLLLGLALGFLAVRARLRESGAGGRHFLVMGGAFALPLLATAAFFASHGALGAMLDCLLWAPRHYSEANQLPYGFITMPLSDWERLFESGPLWERALRYFIISPIFVLCALPIWVVLIALGCAWKPREDLEPSQVSAMVFSGAVVLGALASVLATRRDFTHIVFIAPLYFFLLPWVVERWSAPLTGLRKVAPLVAVYLLCAFAAYGLTLYWPVQEATVRLQTRRGLVHIRENNQTIEFIQAHFPPGSRLLVYPYLPLYSFLTRTFSPLPYDYLQPGMHSREQFEDAAARLRALRPAAALYEYRFGEKIAPLWPRTPLARTAQDPVADYLLQNYRACAVLDRDSLAPFLVMVRKDLPCSDYR